MIFKGLLIGLGKIIPGVSGSVIAISLGVYEKAINILNNIFHSSKNDLIYLIKLLIGIFISIFLFSKIIIYFIKLNYTVTMLFFAGLILGSIIDIKKNIDSKHNILIIISFIFSTLIGLITIKNNLNINNNIIYLILGILESITMIIPGISGTAIYSNLGVYNKYLKFISDLTIFKINIVSLILFSIGLIIGGILTIKLVNYMFKRYNSIMYSIIYGFSLSSVLLMLYKVFDNINILFGLFAFYIGFKITKKSILLID